MARLIDEQGRQFEVDDRPEHLPTVSGEEFLANFKWKQGEHVSMIGPTGRGKTTLSLRLLELGKRRHVAFIATKPRDNVIPTLKEKGYVILRDWPDHIDAEQTPKVVVWPRFRRLRKQDVRKQQQTIHKTLASAFMQTGWTIVLDEVSYITNQLRLKSAVELLWQQGRSLGITVIAGTQRPANVPLFMYDQATHLFFWRENDKVNLDRIAGIGSANSVLVKKAVRSLNKDKRETLYVNAATGGMVVVQWGLTTSEDRPQ